MGVVNRSQADINKNVDMIAARKNEHEYFATSPDYGHLESKMGSQYLAKLLSRVQFSQCLNRLHEQAHIVYFVKWVYFVFQHLESVIKSRIPSISSLINKSVDELESELDQLGRPIAVDAGVSF